MQHSPQLICTKWALSTCTCNSVYCNLCTEYSIQCQTYLIGGGAVDANKASDAAADLDVLVICVQVQHTFAQVWRESAHELAAVHDARVSHTEVLAGRERELSDFPLEASARLPDVQRLAGVQTREQFGKRRAI